MFLILAIEPDRRQAGRLGAIAHGALRNAELLTVDTVEAALALLARRVPDLVLTSMLLSAKDDAALAERLRELDTAGRQVQTLVIPMFAAPRKGSEGGLLARFTKSSDDEGPSHGCQPAVFAAQINEYLDDLQLEREAREMRQPYSAPAEALYQQPTVNRPYQEVVASVPADQVIVPPAAPEPPPAPAQPTPAIVKEPPQVAASSSSKAARPIEPARAAEPSHLAEPPRIVESPRIIEAPRVVEPPHALETMHVIEPVHALETTPATDIPTAEPPRLIAPSPASEPRRSVVKPARAEPIVKPVSDRDGEKVAEPARLIAPSPAAEPPRETIAAAHTEPESPRTPDKPAPPASRPAAPAKAKPKVAKVRFVPPPLHEDPEVAKFMAALNDLPTVDVVETTGEDDAEPAHAEQIAAASPVKLELDLKPTPIPSRQATTATETPRETPPVPKTVKALKPARSRTISPAAAPPSLPASARKRVTPIRRGGSTAAPPDPAPEAPPGAEEPPAATTNAPVKVVGRIQPASSAPAAPAGPRTGKQKGSSRRPRPLQDEWGFFDPDQAGLPAVQAALEEIEEPDIFRNVSKPPKPRA
jgi:hypothetical protein